MARGSKAVSAAKGHRTKAEINARQQAEQDMLSGKPLAEFPGVKSDTVAHAEFRRVAALMKAIGKDDALYSAAVNRYAALFSEITQLQQDAARFRGLMDSLQQKFDESDPDSDDITAFAKAYSGMLAQVNKLDDKGRAAIISNGSPLFSGSTTSGESQIRRWMLEEDLVEAIIALPSQLFYNTDIGIYAFILSKNKRPDRRGKVQLINAVNMWKPL